MPEQAWTPRIRRIDNDGQERLQYVRSLIRERRVDDARAELLSIIEQNDQSIRAHCMLGTLYQGQNMLAEAMDHFQYAVGIDPMDAQAQLLAGVCALRMNELGQAQAMLKTAIDLDPKMVGGHVAYAQVLSRLGDNEAAIAQLEHALRLDPQMAQARMLMAQLLNRTGKTGAAVEELDSFVAANPDHAGATVRLAMLLGQQGDTAKAISLLEAAIRAQPTIGRIWGMLGGMQMRAKDFKGAETSFAEAIKLSPQDRFAPLRLVEAMIPQGKFGEAREHLKKIPRRGRLGNVVHQLYGDIYAGEKMYTQAIESYRAALLNSEGGEPMLKEAEAAGAAEPAAMVARLQAAIAKWREEARTRMAEQMRERSQSGERPQHQPGAFMRRQGMRGAGVAQLAG